MSKGSEIRRRQGFYGPPRRTKPTTGQEGPREPGPHGKTQVRPPKVGSQGWLSDILARAAAVTPSDRRSDHDV